jgi:2,3-bisphosphoglycerate-dependent phosphoglycerate mutase
MSQAIHHFTLLRHGQSRGNAENRHQGQHDFPLTPFGEVQARRLAQRWLAEKRGFDGVISSPLSRARQTAEIIAAALHLSIEFDPLWMERDDGLISGLPFREADAQYPDEHLKTSYTPRGETGESRWDLYLRAGKALQALIERPAGHWLVVSHGGAINAALSAAMGISPSTLQIGPRFGLGNASFAILRYEPARHIWRLICLNDQSHLPQEEPD